MSAKRIAVVDDDASVRMGFHRLLKSAGMDADLFASGADFLCALHDPLPDCVVLDVHMRVTSGFEVQECLAEWGIRLPTIMVTGDYREDQRARAIETGADLLLLKPVDGYDLLASILDAIWRHGAGSQKPLPSDSLEPHRANRQNVRAAGAGVEMPRPRADVGHRQPSLERNSQIFSVGLAEVSDS